MLFTLEMIDKDLLDQINTLCTEYRIQILENFESKLKVKDPFAHTYYYNINIIRNKVDIADEIIEDMLNDNSGLKEDPELKHLLEKYNVVTDIQYTLGRTKNTVEHKRDELIAKLVHHKDLILREWDNTDIQFMQNMANKLGVKRFFNLWESLNLPWLYAMRYRLSQYFLIGWVFPKSGRESLTLFTPVTSAEAPGPAVGSEKEQRLTF